VSVLGCAHFLRKWLNELISMIKLVSFIKTNLLFVVSGVVKWFKIQLIRVY